MVNGDKNDCWFIFVYESNLLKRWKENMNDRIFCCGRILIIKPHQTNLLGFCFIHEK